MERKRSGQVIILTVLILGSTLLGAASVAALLMLYQIRQSSDFGNSGKAIFAADTGIEWSLYNHFNPSTTATTTLSNGTTVRVTCFTDSTPVNCGDPKENVIRSVGTSNNTSRAFKLSF